LSDDAAVTERLYYSDCYLTRFEAQVVEVRPAASSQYHVCLDRTAFYPASGGQPFDLGRIGDARVLEVAEEGESVVHRVDGPLDPGPVACEIDWPRRFDHMQQHTGQHLLSAVFVEQLGSATVSFHLGAETSTIDLDVPELSASQIEQVEARANAVVWENRPVGIRFYSPDEAASIGLRKPSDREGTVRVVEIARCDRTACGGTHVRATGEIGPILIRRLDRVRQSARIEFVCGSRAVRRARADYNTLARIGQLLSAPLDQAAALVEAQIEAAKAHDKVRRKIESELAALKGRELYRTTPPDASGRCVFQAAESAGSLESWRLLAENFLSAGPGAVFLITLEQPPALLLALSPDLNAHAGNLVKSAIEPLGGRGGGSSRLAQGSLRDVTAVADAARRLREALGL
jgi:alanyl-tRNA synthetase